MISAEQVRRALGLCIVFSISVLGLEATGTMASWTDTASVTGTTISAGTLAAPTNVVVNQTCVPEATPIRRSGVGGSSLVTNAGTGATITLPKPSSAATDDVLLASITWSGNFLGGTPTAPSGWTLVRSDGDQAINQFVYTRVVTATEPASYTWSGISGNKAGAIVAYSGVDPAAPVNTTSGFLDDSKGTNTAPSITPTRGNVVVVGVFGLLNGVTQSVPTGMTSIWNAFTGTGNPPVSTLGAEESWPTTTATGTRVSTAPGARTVAQLIALQPRAFPYAGTTWTASSSAYATGQVFERSSNSTVQRTATLGPSVVSQPPEGPLTTGSPYTVSVRTTFHNWTSTTSSTSFNARSCWPLP